MHVSVPAPAPATVALKGDMWSFFLSSPILFKAVAGQHMKGNCSPSSATATALSPSSYLLSLSTLSPTLCSPCSLLSLLLSLSALPHAPTLPLPLSALLSCSLSPSPHCVLCPLQSLLLSTVHAWLPLPFHSCSLSPSTLAPSPLPLLLSASFYPLSLLVAFLSSLLPFNRVAE